MKTKATFTYQEIEKDGTVSSEYTVTKMDVYYAEDLLYMFKECFLSCGFDGVESLGITDRYGKTTWSDMS